MPFIPHKSQFSQILNFAQGQSNCANDKKLYIEVLTQVQTQLSDQFIPEISESIMNMNLKTIQYNCDLLKEAFM